LPLSRTRSANTETTGGYRAQGKLTETFQEIAPIHGIDRIV